MKRFFSIFLAVLLIVSCMPVTFAAEYSDREYVQSVLGELIEFAMVQPDSYYAPSSNVQDYTLGAHVDGCYEVVCYGEVVGYAYDPVEGIVSYTSVNKRAEVVAVNTLYEVVKLPIQPVAQVGNNTCWAVTCEMVINYLTKYNVSEADVVDSVYGTYVDEHGGWTQMKKAYNNYGLYPEETGVMTFVQVYNCLKKNNPVHVDTNQVTSTGIYTGQQHSLLITGCGIGSSFNVYYYNDTYTGQEYITMANTSTSGFTFHFDQFYCLWTASRSAFT